MPLYVLDDEIWFPPVRHALPDGLLAIGGDLGLERLLAAYRNGIFPWYNEDEPPMWWCPDPRFVLFPDELLVSKSMRKILRGDEFTFSTNTAFQQVIKACRSVKRKGMDGTWININIVDAYCELHQLGYAWSAEAWKDGELAGGLYGIKLGKMFFGESMFSTVSNASKFAFVKMVDYLKEQGVVLIDCQVHTDHLASLGARMISRKKFQQILKANIR